MIRIEEQIWMFPKGKTTLNYNLRMYTSWNHII